MTNDSRDRRYRGWLSCYGNWKGETCLYNERSARKLERCIRHGAILDWVPEFYGMTRREIDALRKKRDREEALKAAR